MVVFYHLQRAENARNGEACIVGENLHSDKLSKFDFTVSLLSIVIPTFNPGEKLADSIQSVHAAGDAEVQIIVQDGGSTDGTPEWLAGQNGLDWKSEKDNGVFDAMNKGFARATGDWVLFLGAGDLLRADIFKDGELILVLKEKAKTLSLVYGDAWLCEEGFRYGGLFSRRKLRSWVPSHQAIFYNRRVFDKLGGYELKYRIASDYAFNLSCWGDSSIKKIYVSQLVCDYEGRGLSKQIRDENFEADKMRLIRERLGADAYLLRKVELMMPSKLKELRVKILQSRARTN